MTNFIFHVSTVSFVVLVLMSFLRPSPFDATDDKEKGVRSGLIVKIDHETGCQYLVAVLSNITPRLAEDGKTVVGCKNIVIKP